MPGGSELETSPDRHPLGARNPRDLAGYKTTGRDLYFGEGACNLRFLLRRRSPAGSWRAPGQHRRVRRKCACTNCSNCMAGVRALTVRAPDTGAFFRDTRRLPLRRTQCVCDVARPTFQCNHRSANAKMVEIGPRSADVKGWSIPAQSSAQLANSKQSKSTGPNIIRRKRPEVLRFRARFRRDWKRLPPTRVRTRHPPTSALVQPSRGDVVPQNGWIWTPACLPRI